MNILNFLKTCFNLSSKKRTPELQNIYNKIDHIEKDDRGILILNSSDGLTEQEFLQVLKNEFCNEE